MQLIITDASLTKSRTIPLTISTLCSLTLVASLILVVVAACFYHWLFLKWARAGGPIVGMLLQLVVKDEFAQRDHFMRENLHVLARQVGEMQVKVMLLESLGDRVTSLAALKPNEMKKNIGAGDALVPGLHLSPQQLLTSIGTLDGESNKQSELFTSLETRLVDQKMRSMMIPTPLPVVQADLGSAFGWHIDPFTGASALHTGLDFQADLATSVVAAAGGVVVS